MIRDHAVATTAVPPSRSERAEDRPSQLPRPRSHVGVIARGPTAAPVGWDVGAPATRAYGTPAAAGTGASGLTMKRTEPPDPRARPALRPRVPRHHGPAHRRAAVFRRRARRRVRPAGRIPRGRRHAAGPASAADDADRSAKRFRPDDRRENMCVVVKRGLLF